MYIIYRYFGVNKTKCTYLPPSLTRVTRVTLVRFHTVRLMLKFLCVFLKSCICVKNVLKLNIRALSTIIIVEGLGGLIDILHSLMPTVPHI